MNKTAMAETPDSGFNFFLNKPGEESIDILTSFVRDTEHELMCVLTSLQAQLDLLHREQEANSRPVNRFPGLNRAVSRLIADTFSLAAISDLAASPQSKTKVELESLMQDVVADTKTDCKNAQVSVSCDIARGATLTGEAGSLRRMCGGLLVVLLRQCRALETIRIVGSSKKKRVSISFDVGVMDQDGDYKPWRVGQLRTIPTNGDGIKLAVVDAMARMHQGQLNVRRVPEFRDAYKLTFGF